MRFARDRPFPPYAFLPGRDPHPTRDPQGHSFDTDEDSPGYFSPADWRASVEYLWGVDLYNHGYLWEAHEAWEGLWHEAKHDRDQAEFLQGLIQCAAASLKIPMEQPRGLERLSEAGTSRLLSVARSSPSYMGLDVLDFVAAFRAFAGSKPVDANERPRLALETS